MVFIYRSVIYRFTPTSGCILMINIDLCCSIVLMLNFHAHHVNLRDWTWWLPAHHCQHKNACCVFFRSHSEFSTWIVTLIQFPTSQSDSHGSHIKMTIADIWDFWKHYVHVTGVVKGCYCSACSAMPMEMGQLYC